MTTAELVSVMVERIVAQFSPNQIILFGSQARGDADKFSDVDLLVVLDHIPNKHQTAVEILRSLKDMPIAKDIIPVTPDEIMREGDVAGTVTYEALREGRVMYEKNNSKSEDIALREGRVMYEKNNSKSEDIALRQLQCASKDLAVAQHLINSKPDASSSACWLSQQAAEKAIKAAHILENIRFARTHDLDMLRDILPDGWSVKNEHKDLCDLSIWFVNARYPGDWPEPTCHDAISAESTARSIYDSVAADFKQRGIEILTGTHIMTPTRKHQQ